MSIRLVYLSIKESQLKFLIIFALLFLYSVFYVCQVNGEEDRWIYYVTTKAGSSRYYDPQSIIKTPENTIRVWEKHISSKEDSMILTLYELDCNRRMFKTLQIKIESKSGFISSRYEPKRWENMEPDSIHEKLHKNICK